ncbi:hypothetical protein [Eastern grey kangaroopox virus]|uniref:Uncharacterized protein n=1 Tax=Eastern grey kangaroopox virus TaxID=2042482 RepID=A0A2C9DTB7_9POXV|nr:hypothetical protein KM541_gp154 [Eastern grey kangaroopox virus]ATI21250.1 hypothetical protein [Eastern grey kangaroopox virus]ATX75156.1 hypothetical protein EKPV-NSW-ORF171 [Eastern grey kangaroopox virus]
MRQEGCEGRVVGFLWGFVVFCFFLSLYFMREETAEADNLYDLRSVPDACELETGGGATGPRMDSREGPGRERITIVNEYS